MEVEVAAVVVAEATPGVIAEAEEEEAEALTLIETDTTTGDIINFMIWKKLLTLSPSFKNCHCQR